MEDGTSRSSLLASMGALIYGKINKEHDKRIEQIIVRNSYLDDYKREAFLYKGQQYCRDGYRPQRRIGLLSRDLYPEMEVWLADERELQKEKGTVFNYLTCLVSKVIYYSDLRSLAPECLHSVIPYHDPAAEPKFTQQEIDTFNKQNEEAIGLIKKRMLLNMIT